MNEQENDPSGRRAKINLSKEPREFTRLDEQESSKPSRPAGDQVAKRRGTSLGFLVYLWPLVVTVALGAGGYFGYGAISAQNARVGAAESAAVATVEKKDDAGFRISRLTSEIADFDRRIAEIPAQAELDARTRVDKESAEEIGALRRKTTEAKFALAAATRENEIKANQKTADLKKQAEDARAKLNAVYDKNRAMKTYLNTNNMTMHGAFTIDPRP